MLLSVTLIAYVCRYGSNVPLWDEYQNLPLLLGKVPVSWQNLNADWSEHRTPLLRLILLGLARATGDDFRAPLFLSAALLIATNFALLAAFKNQLNWEHAFIPLLLLHLRRSENLLQGWNLQNVLFAFFACMELICLLKPTTWKTMLGAGLCLVGLALDGAGGVFVAGILSLWVVWRSPRFSVLAMLALGIACYEWMQPRPNNPETSSNNPFAVAMGAIYFLTSNFGLFWPLATALLGLALWRRWKLSGLALFVFAMIGLAVGVSYRRSGIDPRYCFQMTRYMDLAAPLLIALFVTEQRRWLRYAFLGVMIAAFPLQEWHGVQYASNLKPTCEMLEEDLRHPREVSPQDIVASHPLIVPTWGKRPRTERNIALTIEGIEALRSSDWMKDRPRGSARDGS